MHCMHPYVLCMRSSLPTATLQAPVKPLKQHKRAASMQSLPETVPGPMGLKDATGSRISVLNDLDGATLHPELTPTCHSSAPQTAPELQAGQAVQTEPHQQRAQQAQQGDQGGPTQLIEDERGRQPAEGREPPQQKAVPPLSQGSAHLEQLRNMYGLAQGEGPDSRPSSSRAVKVGLLDTSSACKTMLPMLFCWW